LAFKFHALVAGSSHAGPHGNPDSLYYPWAFLSQLVCHCLQITAVNTVLLKREENIAICNYSLQITACNRLLLNKDTLTIFWVLN